MLSNKKQRKARHNRVRARMRGTAVRPRLCVSRTNKYIYAQLIDDEKGVVLGYAKANKNISDAQNLGKKIAEKAKKAKIDKIVFDRGGHKYHGRIKAVAENAREGGLIF